MAADLMPGRPEPDPSRGALLLCAGGIAAGFVGVLLAWVGASTQLVVAAELPWLVSGGLGGIALVGLSTALLAVTLRRRAIAREVVRLDAALVLARQLRGRG